MENKFSFSKVTSYVYLVIQVTRKNACIRVSHQASAGAGQSVCLSTVLLCGKLHRSDKFGMWYVLCCVYAWSVELHVGCGAGSWQVLGLWTGTAQMISGQLGYVCGSCVCREQGRK